MSDIKAYDMSKYQRIIGNDGNGVRGNWHALSGIKGRLNEVLIWPIEVTIYDEGRYSGMVLTRRDFSVVVTDGVPDLDPKNIREPLRGDCEDAWDELMAVIVAVAAEMLAALATDADGGAS